MLRRSVFETIDAHVNSPESGALLLTGARQVGKTTAVRAYAEQAGKQLAELNFYENREAVSVVSGATDAHELLFALSALTRADVTAENTLLFLDEIQECQDMLTWVKFLVDKRGLDIVLSGSLLGIDAFVDARSFPVGYLTCTEMFPLTFEEFCWAAGMPAGSIDTALAAVLDGTPVPEFLHERLSQLFARYLLVGGMPAAAQAYVDTSQTAPVRAIQGGVFSLYEADVAKYVQDKVEARQIKMVYEAIPGQLNAPSKRFKYARLGKNLRFANMETAFDWLEASGIALAATRIGSVEFPIGLSEDRSSLKLFMNDVGMLTSRLMGNVDVEVLCKRTNINYGSIYENVVAQELRAQGFRLHYYSSKSIGEVDFVIEDSRTGDVLPIEVKSGKDYKRHSALANLLERDGAQLERAIVLCNGNASVEGKRRYVPIYLCCKMRTLLEAAR